VGCAKEDVEEIRYLGPTLASWRTEILEHDNTGASNGPTEGLNLGVKKVKRCGHGCRTFHHYRLRVLLHAGGITWPTRVAPPRIRTRLPTRSRSACSARHSVRIAPQPPERRRVRVRLRSARSDACQALRTCVPSAAMASLTPASSSHVWTVTVRGMRGQTAMKGDCRGQAVVVVSASRRLDG
jgi:hypothetical protein